VSDWCQPTQFTSERALIGAVARRLELASLRLLDWGIMPMRSVSSAGYAHIWCFVERIRKPHRRAVDLNKQWQEWARSEVMVELALAMGARESSFAQAKEDGE
jgi:hypothetical protein